jgi:hypothetical protein
MLLASYDRIKRLTYGSVALTAGDGCSEDRIHRRLNSTVAVSHAAAGELARHASLNTCHKHLR